MSLSQHDADGLLERCHQAVAAARKAGAGQAEVFASRGRETEVSVEKNDLNMVRVVDETTLGLRVIVDGKVGFATTNRPDDLQGLVDEALAVARSGEPDPHAGLPDPEALPDLVPRLDQGLAEVEPEALVAMTVELMREALARDSRLTVDGGAIGLEHEARAIASSTGVAGTWLASGATGYLMGMAIDGDEVGSFAYDGDAVQDLASLRPSLSAAFARFVDKAVGALGAGKGESFRGSVFLPADVVGGFFLDTLVSVLKADGVRKGRSPMAGKLGELIASPLLNLTEGGAGLSGYPLAPFDREGLPRRRTPLVEGGVLKAFLYDSYEARAAGARSTANALGGAASLPTLGAACVELGAGETPADELAAMERGVIVTRFSGTHDGVSGDFSGVVKGGFLVRDGERRPIKETTISGNVYEALKQVSGVSRERSTFYGTRCYPSVRLEDLSVTAG